MDTKVQSVRNTRTAQVVMSGNFQTVRVPCDRDVQIHLNCDKMSRDDRRLVQHTASLMSPNHRDCRPAGLNNPTRNAGYSSDQTCSAVGKGGRQKRVPLPVPPPLSEADSRYMVKLPGTMSGRLGCIKQGHERSGCGTRVQKHFIGFLFGTATTSAQLLAWCLVKLTRTEGGGLN